MKPVVLRLDLAEMIIYLGEVSRFDITVIKEIIELVIYTKLEAYEYSRIEWVHGSGYSTAMGCRELIENHLLDYSDKYSEEDYIKLQMCAYLAHNEISSISILDDLFSTLFNEGYHIDRIESHWNLKDLDILFL